MFFVSCCIVYFVSFCYLTFYFPAPGHGKPWYTCRLFSPPGICVCLSSRRGFNIPNARQLSSNLSFTYSRSRATRTVLLSHRARSTHHGMTVLLHEQQQHCTPSVCLKCINVSLVFTGSGAYRLCFAGIVFRFSVSAGVSSAAQHRTLHTSKKF